MEFVRLFTGDDQQSHFEDVSMTLSDAEYGKVSDSLSVSSIIFGEIDDVDEAVWHNPPCRQYVIMLKGKIEIEIGDGTRRTFNEGDVILADDLYRARAYYARYKSRTATLFSDSIIKMLLCN